MRAIASPAPMALVDGSCDEAFPVSLGELLGVLSEITDDEREIVATALCMIRGGKVRLVEPGAW